jgi:hypothetical protein
MLIVRKFKIWDSSDFGVRDVHPVTVGVNMVIYVGWKWRGIYELALPEADSTMAFIFRARSSVSRWMDCR